MYSSMSVTTKFGLAPDFAHSSYQTFTFAIATLSIDQAILSKHVIVAG